MALVRISGDRTRPIIERLFEPSRAARTPPAPLRPRHVYCGFLVDPDTRERVDEVLVTLFAEGASYTGEAMAEIGCHGGMTVVDRVLRALFAAGARPAEPGEFSKRAFLSGRIDLAQAEAVCDLIRARSDAARRAALRQLEGGLSARIRAVRGVLLDALADIEVTIDFPDDDILPATTERAADAVGRAQRMIDDLLARAAVGQAVREGVVVSIVGRPNVGKSSLLNALLGRDRAIVTDTPGTTRDTVEEVAVFEGIPFRLIDTAGLRRPGDDIEAIGVGRAEAAAAAADLCVAVFDGSAPLEEADEEVIGRLRTMPGARVGVLNKSDLPPALDAGVLRGRLSCQEWTTTSAVSPGGVESLIGALVRAVAAGGVSAQGELLTNARHRKLLESARAELDGAALAARQEMPIDIMAISIRAGAGGLGEITGDTLVPDLLDRIFSTFCLGK